jgi:hypothetical protein
LPTQIGKKERKKEWETSRNTKQRHPNPRNPKKNENVPSDKFCVLKNTHSQKQKQTKTQWMYFQIYEKEEEEEEDPMRE